MVGEKRLVAEEALKYIKDGYVVGIGTGSYSSRVYKCFRKRG